MRSRSHPALALANADASAGAVRASVLYNGKFMPLHAVPHFHHHRHFRRGNVPRRAWF